MDAIEAIHTRRSVRSYLDQPLERELIEALIWDAAQAPPPAIRDLKRWVFVVVEGRERLAEMGARAKAFARATLPPGPVPAWLDNAEFKVFWDAPALIVICARADVPDADWDCCRAGQNLMLSAHARGLGSCWVGSPMAWLESPEGAATVGMPEGFSAVAPILVGHPAAAPPPRENPRPEIVWPAA
ncbi:MAG TPA: nitroreductase family protein [Caulobacteraceae bacterium]|nr:nitroreductase family protein [Caulobacteraceae bacterium]